LGGALVEEEQQLPDSHSRAVLAQAGVEGEGQTEGTDGYRIKEGGREPLKKKPTKGQKPLLKVGWWAALTLKPDVAPRRCYVGQIQAISDDGIRITLVDWISGLAGGYDFYIPHRNIESALVCTEEQDFKGLGDHAGKWQTNMDEKDKTPSTENAESSATPK
jgi:hypothetical protein